MSKKILVATEKPFAKAAVDSIGNIAKEAGYNCVFLEKYTSKEQLLNAVTDVEALIIRSDKVDVDVLEAAKNLKIVVRAGAGYDNVDLAKSKEKGVVVMNTPGQNSNAVAELVIGMMVFLCRNKFNGKPGTELKGKKIGIHAIGNVGKIVANLAKGFGMECYAFDPFVNQDDYKGMGVTFVSNVEELYSTCQYISLHIPANDQTKKSINLELLSKMPKNGVLVNTARKEVIDEEGLLKLFSQREDIKYLSDIAPDNKNEFEEKFADRVFFTPKKMGAQTAEANINAGIAAINQIIAFFNEGDTTFQVNK